MPNVEWSPEAQRAAFRLSVSARQELLRAVDRLRRHPEMGRMVEEGRFRGHRRMLIRPHWLLYYRVVGEDRTCVLRAIRDARSRSV